MDPRDFLRNAEENIHLASSLEANYRSAISRAYYSNFLSIQNSLLKQVGAPLLKQAQLSNQLGHEWIVSALRNSHVDAIAEIGKFLDKLLKIRKCADYNMTVRIERSDAVRELQNSKFIPAAIDAFGLPKIVAYLIQHIRDLAKSRGAHPSA